MIHLPLTEDEIHALDARVDRLNAAADRALADNNDRKAERLTDKADALQSALWCVSSEDDAYLFTEDDAAVIVEALKREREAGNL